jgi:hypothetical protein
MIIEVYHDALTGPACKQCGADTRVVGVERHWAISRLAVVTLQCALCGFLDAKIAMPVEDKRGVEHAR